jgi:23S rRNA (cytidine1920-2'-O)/16S rRNA (cytidine1409-2'-O)-methyltransferase
VTGSRRYVSRGGEKLAAALDRFGVDVSELRCFDAGASTGGFTHVLLERGARHVIAADVGYGLLAWELRTDPRVTVMERTNVRRIGPDDLAYRPELVVADLSFISLAKVLPALRSVAAPGATFVLLVKPQFEAARSEVERGGVVRDASVWHRVLERVATTCREVDLAPLDVMASPLLGPAGNVEFFLIARGGDTGAPLQLDLALQEAAALVDGKTAPVPGGAP